MKRDSSDISLCVCYPDHALGNKSLHRLLLHSGRQKEDVSLTCPERFGWQDKTWGLISSKKIHDDKQKMKDRINR